MWRTILIIACLAMCNGRIIAQDPPVDGRVFESMPSAEQAIAGVTGKDDEDRSLRAIATLEVLRQLIQFDDLAPDHKPLLPVETAKMDEYKSHGRKLFEDLVRNQANGNTEALRAALGEKLNTYAEDPQFRSELVDRLLDTEAREAYTQRQAAKQVELEAATAEGVERDQAESNATAASDAKLGAGGLMAALGAAMVIAAIYLLWRSLRINRRLNRYEFEHRTAGGVVAFDTDEAEQAHRRARARAAMAVAAAFVLLLLGLGVLLGGGADLVDALEA